ncbi:MAG TPA: SMP-30/gluconolactonase/LRE family protein [Patescibacteria group bacterium]|nr:SMP-30/gluconolactonase/LRE family protein [Patescibacteria group bacterium]
MRYTLILVMVLLISCSQAQQIVLQEHWATERVMKTPESILYDTERDVLYVSNINGSPMGKDQNGFISKLSTGGEILELEWVTGLNAPKGAGIAGGTLYVTDIDELVAIDIDAGTIIRRYPAPGAVFLNDVAVDGSGNVYISDSSKENSVIYRFDGNHVAAWLHGDEISMPNGLSIDGDHLLVGNSGDGSIKRVDLDTKAIARVATVGSGIDGLRRYGEHGFVVSDWKGRITLVRKSGDNDVLIDTTDAKINAADLEIVSARRLLVVPTFYDDRVVAYTIGTP